MLSVWLFLSIIFNNITAILKQIEINDLLKIKKDCKWYLFNSYVA